MRHLKPDQVAQRVRRGVRPRAIQADGVGTWRLRPRRPVLPARRSPAGFDGGSFVFLNRRHQAGMGGGWEPAGAERLWIYNLHYFHYLWGLPADAASRLILDWMDANPPTQGPGWEPYPIALRLREWIEWLHSAEGAGVARRGSVIASVAAQARALEGQVEFHLGGNHLLENAISLCWAGLSLDGPGSGVWVRVGLRLLVSCLSEQVLADGGHDERSPMYQSILAESLLRLAEVASAASGVEAEAIRSTSREAGLAMAKALQKMTHPDGQIALLNDSGFEIAPTAGDLSARFAAVGVSPDHGAFDLPSTGLAGYRSAAGDYLVFDRGPLGPDHQPGHGHADTLGFELSLRGRRLVTDSGVFTYTPGLVRSSDRSTSAHSTLTVDGRNQADLWESFRCGDRPSITDTWGGEINDGVLLGGGFEGPSGPFGTVRHRRRLRYVEGQGLAGLDDVSCEGRHQGAIRFHLAPGLRTRWAGDSVEVRDGLSLMASFRGAALDWSVERTNYHPEFGKEIERDCVVARAPFSDRLVAVWNLDLGDGRG